MIANKGIDKIVAVIVALAVVLCCIAMGFAEELTTLSGGTGVSMEYRSRLFDTSSPITVNILMEEADWQDMLDNAAAEVYHKCTVEIQGETFYEVGIRPKGNTSLSSIASNPDTDRYSFKLEFDQYIDGQTCFGLDKLVLNNNYADATNMKEALIYDMYQYLGADASLYNYAEIRVNGEYWGVYLALEAVEDSFLLRNYGVSSGELYKPESMDMGGGGKPSGKENFSKSSQAGNPGAAPEGGFGGEMPQGDNAFGGGMPSGNNSFAPSSGTFAGNDGFSSGEGMPQADNTFGGEMPQGDSGFDPGSNAPMGGGFGGENGDFAAPGGMDNFSMGGSGGANLNYSDDDLDSYSTIWDGEVTKTSQTDHTRVVEALKNISQGNDLETYMDIDNLLRYMAVHVFSVNSDSLTGNMAHNYYLYEKNGRLNLIPWDYNLALGGMDGGGDASGVVNSPIDGAFKGTNFFDTLLENEDYLQQYHNYLSQLVAEYIEGGGFDEFYSRTRAILDELVATDPTAFYDYEEYSDAADTLYQVVKLRGQSISGQLDGSIPSTQSAQQQNSAGLVDTGDLDLSIMGSMNMGNGDMGGGGGFKGFGGGFQFGGGFVGGSGFDPSQLGTPPDGTAQTTGAASGFPEGGEMPQGFDLSQQSNPLPQGMMPSQPGNLPEGTQPSTDTQAAATASTQGADVPQMPSIPENAGQMEAVGRPDRGNMAFPGQSGNTDSSVTIRENLITYGISFAIFLAGLIFVSLYKRKSTK